MEAAKNHQRRNRRLILMHSPQVTPPVTKTTIYTNNVFTHIYTHVQEKNPSLIPQDNVPERTHRDGRYFGIEMDILYSANFGFWIILKSEKSFLSQLFLERIVFAYNWA